jgi:hypothetical protein
MTFDLHMETNSRLTLVWKAIFIPNSSSFLISLNYLATKVFLKLSELQEMSFLSQKETSLGVKD